MQNEIQIGRWNAILHKLLQMKEGSPAPLLASDIFPTMVLENDRPEWKFLAGERLCSGGYVVAASGAGTYGAIALVNPAGSGILTVLEEIEYSVTGTGTYVTQHILPDTSFQTAWVGAVVEHVLDARYGQLATGGAVPSSYLVVKAPAALTGASDRLHACWDSETYTEVQVRKRNVVLNPGSGVAYQTSNDDSAMSVSFRWRERLMEKSETR